MKQTPYNTYALHLLYSYPDKLDMSDQWLIMNFLEALDKLNLYANIP